ncbi:hypothetical protein BU17DRAFT_6062, partial [Hysterangium stoloniferum]
PTYGNINKTERNLPQHNLDLPFPEGRTGRYVKFSNQIVGLGWNNVLNEVLLNSHLAWRAKRSYVFQPYEWRQWYFPWNVTTWTPHTPLNALIAGPTAGGPWSANDPSPRAISETWFDTACPPEDTFTIEAVTAKNPVREHNADEVMEYWVKLLDEHPSRCINVVSGQGDDFPQTFDLWTVSTPRILPLWDEFRKSPVSRLLRTAPIVNAAIKNNEEVFFPPKSLSSFSRFNGMMGIHLRRGDYASACQDLADWNSTFYMWNLLPGLPDPLNSGPPVQGESAWGKNTVENYALYRRRCFPTEEELVTKIMESKLDWETGSEEREKLKTLYIMTNAKEEWLDAFRARMIEEGWETVATTSDLWLDSDQLAVSMAVDMDIARRAALFVGNGWSSMSSNIVHRRLVDGHSYDSIRFW